MARHIVIGGSGFVGTVLSDRLARAGHEVVVVDLTAPPPALATRCAFRKIDISSDIEVRGLELRPDDIVTHLAARQFHGDVPAYGQTEWFSAVNVVGTRNLLEHMQRSGCRRLVYLSTDMIYGIPDSIPVAPTHPQRPLGPYGASKQAAEALCIACRARGMSVTILRPRMIIGPGRLGILVKLFRLIDRNLPVPMIGAGKNAYQMISVFDVVSAIEVAIRLDCPNLQLNLGSDAPPSVRALLRSLVRSVGSRSIVLPTPGFAVKSVLTLLEAMGLPLMHREQYAIADVHYLVDIEPTKQALGWRPQYSDADMLAQAYKEYRAGLRPNS